MKTKKEKIRKFIKFIKESWKDPQKKAILMLIIMFLFFSFVVISVRTTHSNMDKEVENPKDNTFEFSLSNIENSNYHFIYTVKVDDNITIYEGDRFYDKELFSIGEDKYYRYKDVYLKDIKGVWSTFDNPYLFSDFKEIDKIQSLLKLSSFLSKTEYNDSNKVYNYNITTSTILKTLESIETDIDDISNVISITTDSEGNAIEINYDLSSYSIYKKLGNKVSLNIKYTKFGEIENIEDPK